jgi:hypothetical protein
MKQRLDRRTFGKVISVSAAAGAVIVNVDCAAAAETETCNFLASFMTWDFPFRPDPRPYARHRTPHGNLARIQLDAIIDVLDGPAGAIERYVLIAPCRAEWVYAEDRLFQLPPREYRNIYSLTSERSMERHLTADSPPAKARPIKDTFRSLKIDVKSFRSTRALGTSAEIVSATAANLPLVGRTELTDPDGRRRYLLQYPIKTMNFQPKTNSFQVDTGPVLTPDFNAPAGPSVDRLELAHVAYNRLDRAEFILRRPTPIRNTAGAELCRVLDYSEAREDAAKNQIVAGVEV